MIQTTEQELQAIVAQLKPYIMEYIRQYSVGVGEIELATTLEGVYSLPALMRIGGVDKIVEVPVELLQVAVSNVVDECVAATQSANTAAQAATDAGNSASAVIADLEELKTSITQAISESATAIQGANTAKDNANTAAAAANEAADKANKAAEGVSESISAANTAAQGANKAKENAETAANAAVEAAGKVDSSITASRNLPKIQNGTWWVYDIESETYVDSGNPATGRSPKIQDGTWWVWNDETSQYANTGVSVNSAYELTKEKVENVLTGDITSHTHSKYLTKESDPTVPSWAKQATKPIYTASEVGALPATTKFKTINGESITGEGDILIVSGTSDLPDLTEVLESIYDCIYSGDPLSDEHFNLLKEYAKTRTQLYLKDSSGYISSIVDLHYINDNIELIYYDYNQRLTVEIIKILGSNKNVSLERIETGNAIPRQFESGNTDITIALYANRFYLFGSRPSITISSLKSVDSGFYNEYMFTFTSGDTPTVLNLPESVKWNGGKAPVIEPNKEYIVAIVEGIAVIGGA